MMASMGHVYVEIRVGAVKVPAPSLSKPIRVLVDTGATFTQLPTPALEKAGIPRLREIKLKLADGRTIVRSVGPALIKVDGSTVTGDVIFAEKGDASLLGVITLEAAGLSIDPVARRLVHTPFVQFSARPAPR